MQPPSPSFFFFFAYYRARHYFSRNIICFSLRKCLSFDCISGQLFSGFHSNTYHSRPFLLENQKKVELILRVECSLETTLLVHYQKRYSLLSTSNRIRTHASSSDVELFLESSLTSVFSFKKWLYYTVCNFTIN